MHETSIRDRHRVRHAARKRRRRGRYRRAAAITALVVGPLALLLACVLLLSNLPLLVCAGLAVAAGLWGIVRRGAARVLGLAAAAVLLAVALAIVVGEALFDDGLVVAVCLWAVVTPAAAAFAIKPSLAPAPPPDRPVLFLNPRSGGGKAEKFHLAEEAERRGIRPVVLGPGDDLPELVERELDAGADALAMAGGDGSQAVVAAAAAERGVAYACVPAGTRNHFALDLGVDRDDVVGALDAFVVGGERLVDLAEVNGRVFVNNASLGVYAEAVQRPGYREAKIRTLAEAAPVIGPEGEPLDLRWTGPHGHEHASANAILISNDPYRLGSVVASGTRPRLDAGVLGVAVMESRADSRRPRLERRPWRQWSAPEFEIRSSAPVAAGIDGEAVVLEPPLLFRSRPRALRVRVACAHPGMSPSATLPDSLRGAVRALVEIAAGRTGAPAPGTAPAVAQPAA